MTIHAGFMLFIWGIALGTAMAAAWLTHRHLNEQPAHLDAPFGLYPVSILKPLKGVDEGLAENLESFFKIDYPVFELLFSLSDSNDPARSVVENLIKKYPKVSVKLVISRVNIGPNPKVNNLVKTYESAKHEWLLISDSNVRVKPNYVKRLVAHLEPNVGMVTAVVAGQRPEGLGGYLEATQLNTFITRGMILADKLGHPCVIGKSMLFRRSVANRFGGIYVLGKYLAEDYMAGEAMRALGLRVVIAHDAVDQQIGKNSFESFWQRHVRWGRIRKAQAPIPFSGELFLSCLVSGCLGAFGARSAFGWSPALFLACHLAVWAACDAVAIRALKCKLSIGVALAWFLRELLVVPLWIKIASGNTVQWRGKELVIQSGGMIEIPNESPLLENAPAHTG